MRFTRSLVTVGILLTVTASASAGVIGAIARDFHTSYHRNKCWPEPFVHRDNMSVRAPFARMIHNGWRLQNLVAAHHFTDTTVLNEAGQRHIRWVLTQAPARHRTVYVEQGASPEETETRLLAARNFAQRFSVDGEFVDVRPTHVTTNGWPADYIDAINARFSESIPDPRLPAESTGFDASQ